MNNPPITPPGAKVVRPPTKQELTDPYDAYFYAKYVLHAPFPAGEAAIAKKANYAYLYAHEVLRGPFPAGEEAIATDPYWAYIYALNVLHAPFPAGEEVISKDPYRWSSYLDLVRQWKEDREEFMADLDASIKS